MTRRERWSLAKARLGGTAALAPLIVLVNLKILLLEERVGKRGCRAGDQRIRLEPAGERPAVKRVGSWCRENRRVEVVLPTVVLPRAQPPSTV